jgi:hypothetical protein
MFLLFFDTKVLTLTAVTTVSGGMVRLDGFHLSADLAQTLSVGWNQLQGTGWSPSKRHFVLYTVNLTRLADETHTHMARVRPLSGPRVYGDPILFGGLLLSECSNFLVFL